MMEGILQETEEQSVVQVLNSMMQQDNIGMKTDIPDVAALLKLRILSKWMKQNGLDESAVLIDEWIEFFLVDMVSSERKSRKEVTDVLKALRSEPEMSFQDKLMGGPK